MKVCITGGTGTISSGLVQESVDRGNETYAITRGNNNKRNISGANYLHANIWDSGEMTTIIGELKFDVVVETQAYGVEQLKISLQNFAEKCSQFIFVSTAGIYDRVGDKRIKESDPKDFIEWSYTKNKIECERYLKEYSQKTGLNYTIIRPTVTYGDYRIPFPIATRTPGWTFFERMKSGQIMLASDNVKFSIIHIADFSKMVVALFGNDKAMNQDFHITSDNNDIYWDDVITEAGKQLGVNPKIVHVKIETIQKIWPMLYDEIAYHKNTTQLFDGSKIRNATGVDANINLKEGLHRIIAAMHSEYEVNHLCLDEGWNDYCNATIYYAYCDDALSAEEKDIVSDYIEYSGKESFEKSLKNVEQYNKDKKIGKLKSRIKNMIKRVIK